jgi:hypothetical protein
MLRYRKKRLVVRRTNLLGKPRAHARRHSQVRSLVRPRLITAANARSLADNLVFGTRFRAGLTSKRQRKN